jgi:disulfide bond formation protein DsbB
MAGASAPATLGPGRLAALVAGALAFLVILAALVLEHGFGYAPCPLCLTQRWPYYLGVPLAVALGMFGGRLGRLALALGLVLLAALFAWGLVLGIYQAGAEWGFWLGPLNCAAGNSAPEPGDVGGLIAAIEASRVVSCTDPRLRILGLSLAGWNAMVMASLIALVVYGAWREVRSR